MPLKSRKMALYTMASEERADFFDRVLSDRYSMFVVRCSMFVVRCSLFVVRCLLFVVLYSLFVIP